MQCNPLAFLHRVWNGHGCEAAKVSKQARERQEARRASGRTEDQDRIQ